MLTSTSANSILALIGGELVLVLKDQLSLKMVFKFQMEDFLFTNSHQQHTTFTFGPLCLLIVAKLAHFYVKQNSIDYFKRVSLTPFKSYVRGYSFLISR